MNRQQPTWYLGTFTVCCVACVLLAAMINYRIGTRTIIDLIRVELDNQLQDLLMTWDADVSNRLSKIQHSRQYSYTLLDIQGVVLDKSISGLYIPSAKSNEVIQARRTGEGFSINYSKPERIHYYSLALRLPSGKRIIHISTKHSVQSKLRSEGLFLLFIVLIMIFVGTVILIRLVTSRFIRPLEVVEAGVSEFSSGNFRHSIYVDRKSNLFRLARTMNKMAVELNTRLQTIQHQTEELEAILNGMIEPVIVLNGYLVVLRCNFAASELMGKSVKDAIGHSILDVYRNSKVYDFARKTKNSRSYKETVIRVNEFEGTGGPLNSVSSKLRILQAYGICIKNGKVGDEEDTRIVIVFNDVTRLKRLEDIRKDFVANVSHELKTPVAAIQGFVETLLDGTSENQSSGTMSNKEILYFLNIIREHSLRLNLIIEDLLSLSRLEQDEYEIRMTELNIASIAEEVIISCSTAAKEKETQIQKNIPNDAKLKGDEGLIRQALINLVDNAVKYSPKHSLITIEYENNSNGTALISVSDNGNPIPDQAQNRIFERFYRMDLSHSRKITGTGLGLSIVRHIMIVHGGEVHLDSSPAGNRFILVFP